MHHKQIHHNCHDVHAHYLDPVGPDQVAGLQSAVHAFNTEIIAMSPWQRVAVS